MIVIPLLLLILYVALDSLEVSKAYGIHEEVPLSGEDAEDIGKLPETNEKLFGNILWPDPNKWIGYGVNPPIDTEVKGTVIALGYDDEGAGNGFIYLMPDQNYKHLLIRGNYIAPQPAGKDKIKADDDYDWWNINLKTNYLKLDLPFNGIIPVIKMEPTDSAPSLNRNYGHEAGYVPHYKETDLYKPGKPVQIGDRLLVTGLYALELQHTMYGDCRPPFMTWLTMFRYGGPACYGHAEIHPYNISSITSLPDDVRPHDVVKESHTFGFPVYTMVFHTNVFNNLNELKGHLPDESRYREIKEVFFIKAPPKPVECGFVDDINCRIIVNENIESGKKANIVNKKIESDGVRIWVHITDDNFKLVNSPMPIPILNVSVANPYVLKATWSVFWECFTNTPCSKGDPRPQPVTIKVISKPLLEKSLLPDVPSHCNEFPTGPGCPISRSYTFTSNNNVASSARFQCGLDGSDFVDCTSPYSQPRTSVGWHILQVRGIDSQGKVNLPASYVTWKTSQQPFETIPPSPECTDIETDLIEIKKELIRLQNERNSPIKEQADPDPSPTLNDLAAMIADLQTEIKEKEKELQDCIKQHSPTPPASPAPASSPSPSAITNIPGSQSPISSEQELLSPIPPEETTSLTSLQPDEESHGNVSLQIQ